MPHVDRRRLKRRTAGVGCRPSSSDRKTGISGFPGCRFGSVFRPEMSVPGEILGVWSRLEAPNGQPKSQAGIPAEIGGPRGSRGCRMLPMRAARCRYSGRRQVRRARGIRPGLILTWETLLPVLLQPVLLFPLPVLVPPVTLPGLLLPLLVPRRAAPPMRSRRVFLAVSPVSWRCRTLNPSTRGRWGKPLAASRI